MVVECDHPTAGKIRQIGLPFRFNNFEFSIREAPPLLGEHTNEILFNLDYTKSEIQEFRKSKVVQ